MATLSLIPLPNNRNRSLWKYFGFQSTDGRKIDDGQDKTVYCKTERCTTPKMHVGGVKLERLVKSLLQKYSHLTGDNGYLTAHLQNTFHEDCMTKACAFISMMHSSTGDVAQQLDSVAAAQRQRNRRALERIIIAVEFHGRLGLPLLWTAAAIGTKGRHRL